MRLQDRWRHLGHTSHKPQPPQTSTNPLIPPVLTSAKSISQWCRRRGVSLCTLSGSRKHNLCSMSGPRCHLLSSAPRGHTRRRRNTPQEYLKTCHLLYFLAEFWREGVAGARPWTCPMHSPVSISTAKYLLKRNKLGGNKEGFFGSAHTLLQLSHWRAHTPLPTLFCSDFFGPSCRHVFSQG